MSDTPPSSPAPSERPWAERSWAVLALAVLLFLVGVAGALARKAEVPLLVMACIPFLFLARRVDLNAVWQPTPAIVAALVLATWATLSTMWSAENHILSLVRVAITIAMGIFVVRATACLPEALGRSLDRWIVGGSLFLVAFLIEEKLSGAWVSGLLHPEPINQTSTFFFPKVFVYAGGGAAVLAPTCFAVATLIYIRTRTLFWPIFYVVAAFIACAIMPMAAAPLAIFLGGLAFIAAYFFRRFAFAVIFAGFSVVLVLAPVAALKFIPPPTVIALPDTPVADFAAQDATALRSRLATWRYVADRISEAPVLGHGFDASRTLSDKDVRLPGGIFAAIPVHPHSGALQVWLELGGVGVLCVLGLLATAWRAALRIERPLHAAVAASTVVAGSIPVLVSFSLWNTWWLATLAFAAVFAARAIKAE